MDMVVVTEVDRRAWAMEQAIKLFVAAIGSDTETDGSVTQTADKLLAYVSQPVAAASSKLIDAARAYDGTQNAAALIGALADALESREVR